MKKISDHITYKEATKSNYAIKHNIENIPDENQLKNMRKIANIIFEPLRAYFEYPIGISSFFRSKKLNKALNGADNSQHCKGEAFDLDADIYNSPKISNSKIFYYIKNYLDFDQLIWEFGNNNNPAWIHCSYVSKEKNRNEILISQRINKKVIYINYVEI